MARKNIPIEIEAHEKLRREKKMQEIRLNRDITWSEFFLFLLDKYHDGVKRCVKKDEQ